MMILIVVDFNLHGLFHIRIGWNTHLQWMRYIVYLALQPGPPKYVFLATPLVAMIILTLNNNKEQDYMVMRDNLQLTSGGLPKRLETIYANGKPSKGCVNRTQKKR